MEDSETAAENEEENQFNIPKQFCIDEIDDNMLELLSSSDDDNQDEDNDDDYLSQIENNEKIQQWWDKQKNTNNNNKNKRKRDELDDDKDNDNNDDNDDNNDNDMNKRRKYNELITMEQSTSGLNIDHIRESQLFREFRVIGLVCNDIPFCHQKLGDSFFIGTSIGKSFQIYQGKTLRLKISGRTTNDNINAMIMNHELTFTAVGNNVEIWYRVKKV